MKRRFVAVLLALVMCLGLLPTTGQAAYAAMDVEESRTLTCSSSSCNSIYEWSVDDDSILDYDSNGRSCTIKGKRAGSTQVWVFYYIEIEDRTVKDGKTIITRRTERQHEIWGIIVKDPSAPNPPVPASLPTPSRVAGKVGQDMNGLITGIKDFNSGLVPVQYDGLWGLANAELKLVVPCQFDDIGSITDTGYLDVKMDGKYYIIDTKCEVVFAYSPTSEKESVTCHSGYFTVVRVYSSGGSRVGDARVAEHYNYLGELISVAEANSLDAARDRRREEEGVLAIMEKRGKAADGSILWLFCKPSQQYQKNPEVVLQMPSNGRTNQWLDLQEGLFGVYDWQHCGAVDRKGKLVIPCEYDYLGPSQDGYMSYQKGNKFGLLKNPVNPPSGEVVEPDLPDPDNVTPAAPVFSDVSADAYYAIPVGWAVKNNITNGKTATTFAPDLKCSHAEILTFLWRAAGEPKVGVETPFHVEGYYADAARWAYSKGMIDKSFKPGNPCTRADAVRYIWYAFDQPPAGYDGRFKDVPAGSPYAAAVAWAVDKGVTTGTSDTTFSPNKVCDRGTIVTFLYRAYK